MNTATERSLSVEITAAGVMDALRRQAPDAPAAELEALAAVLEPFLKNLPSTIEALTAMTKALRVANALQTLG